MFDFSAPDGTSQPLTTNSVQHLGTLLPFSHAFLDVRTEAGWEQAGVVYINRIRQPQLLGNYHHQSFLGLPNSRHAQHIMVAGWHKRSSPDGGEPWKASNGRLQGVWSAGWDDSGGDQDYDDLQVAMILLPGPRGQFPFHLITERYEEVPAWNPADFLTAVANLKTLVAQMPQGTNKTAIDNFADEILSKVIENYSHEHATNEFWTEPLSPELVLAAQLNFIANTYPESDLRTELLRQVEWVLMRGKTSKKRAK